jgi:hypothetical protein
MNQRPELANRSVTLSVRIWVSAGAKPAAGQDQIKLFDGCRGKVSLRWNRPLAAMRRA